VVGDHDAVRVASEIVEQMFSAAGGWLGIDDPVLGVELSEELSETFPIRQLQQGAVELELAVEQKLLEFSE